MTLSNFNQTDKQVQQWFLLLPDGHEGPYSIEQLEVKVKGGLSADCKVWRQGSEESVLLKNILNGSAVKNLPMDELPPLPPIPSEASDELPPDIPTEAEFVPEITIATVKEPNPFIKIVIGVVLVLGVFVGVKTLLEAPSEVSWSRPQKMTVETYRVLSEKLNSNSGGKVLFFYEATSPDYSRFWLVTPMDYNCDIEASFIAEEADILSVEGIKKISFKSKAKLTNHVAEFDSFAFEEGAKLVPGFYKMNLLATNCEWASFQTKLSHWFKSPEKTAELSYRIAITAQSVEFLSSALKKLAEEKIKLEQRKKIAADQFWQDVQQKYQTLLAVSLQIEQHFLDFMGDTKSWSQTLKVMVDKYTRQYGSLLTNFVISNEEDFKKLRSQKVKNISTKTAYEKRIRTVAKNMGLQSMTLIEEWQKMAPKDAIKKRPQMSKKIIETYSVIKKDIENKIIDVTEEQASIKEE